MRDFSSRNLQLADAALISCSIISRYSCPWSLSRLMGDRAEEPPAWLPAALAAAALAGETNAQLQLTREVVAPLGVSRRKVNQK